MKKIPLDSFSDYYCDMEGNIYNKNKKLVKGVIHRSYSAGYGYDGKVYRRYLFLMKNGMYKNFYGHRLVAMTFLNLKENEIVRHITPDTLKNGIDFIATGTHYENQTIDRIKNGTYMNRGRQIKNPGYEEPGF